MKIEPDLWESLWPWQVATQGEGMIESWLCFFRRDNARKIPKVTALVFFTFVSKSVEVWVQYRQQFWSWQDTFWRKFKSTTILIWAGYARHGYGGQLEGELRHSMTRNQTCLGCVPQQVFFSQLVYTWAFVQHLKLHQTNRYGVEVPEHTS